MSKANPFTIECRFTSETPLGRRRAGKWHRWKGYKNSAWRDQALQDLLRNHPKWIEFRAGD